MVYAAKIMRSLMSIIGNMTTDISSTSTLDLDFSSTSSRVGSLVMILSSLPIIIWLMCYWENH